MVRRKTNAKKKLPIDTVTAISYNNNRKQITKKDRAWSVVRVQQAMLF